VGIQHWHWGKVIILWVWGGTLSALLLTVFVLEPVNDAPARAAVSLVLMIAVLLALSAITWRWLGGKEQRK
jgi:hypothetical protein